MNSTTHSSVTFDCWCGSVAGSVLFREPHYALIECRSCLCRRIDPPPVTSEVDAGDFYRRYYSDSLERGGPPSSFASRLWSVVAQVPALQTPGGTVIDVGCGDGDLCGELAEAGWRSVRGIDLAPTRIARARARHPELEFFDRPIAETPIPHGSADLVVMDNVLEHLPNPLTAVSGLVPYLGDGGRLVLITPNMSSGHARLLGRRWTPELAPHAHVFLFTPPSLMRLLSAAGLEVEATGSFHLAGASAPATFLRLCRGDVKGALWRALQDLGGLYGRFIGSGPMLYAVARAQTRRMAAGAGQDTGARRVSVVVCTYRRPVSAAALFDSLERQDAPIHEVVVVDASPEAEAAPTRARIATGLSTAGRTHYVHVDGPGRGLTRQRNTALSYVTGELVLFLDDDVLLQPGCIRRMSDVHRQAGESIAGVGCYSDDQFEPPPLVWRLRRWLRVVPSLQPGRYCRSGLSIPWGFDRPAHELVDGDWLPGGAMMWRTEIVREIRFDESLAGYAQAEDLDFSLRAKPYGRLVMLSTPLMRHVHAQAGRPDAFQLGYMELRNRYRIHHRALPNRTWRDVAWFCYAWSVDTLLLARHLAVPGRMGRTVRQILGRMAAARSLVVEHVRPS
jgi:GT2 family glycosyltransferase/SAM-dependent methyltransferase